ncbi:MAG: Uncharacterised protein [Synechococcus sp. CC9902]|nr:MAG: Uncharacterised protein [Synechococcus sp. CC9902]
MHGDRIAGHQVCGREVSPAFGAVLLQRPAQITVREDSHQHPWMLGIFHPATADPITGEATDHLREWCLRLQRVQLAGGQHQISSRQRQLFAERASWMVESEVGW